MKKSGCPPSARRDRVAGAPFRPEISAPSPSSSPGPPNRPMKRNSLCSGLVARPLQRLGRSAAVTRLAWDLHPIMVSGDRGRSGWGAGLRMASRAPAAPARPSNGRATSPPRSGPLIGSVRRPYDRRCRLSRSIKYSLTARADLQTVGPFDTRRAQPDDLASKRVATSGLSGFAAKLPRTNSEEGRLTLPISGPLRGGLVARPLQAGPERWARGLPNGDRHPYPTTPNVGNRDQVTVPASRVTTA